MLRGHSVHLAFVRRALATLCVLLCQGQVQAQTAGGSPVPGEPPTVLGLLSQARAAPAEFRADTLLTLAATASPAELRASKTSALELIREAMDATREIEQSWPVYSIAGGSDSLSGQAVAASQQGFDRLSMETRAGRLLLALDPDAAVRHFLSITLDVRPEDCSEPVVNDVREYYELARELLSELPEARRTDVDKVWQQLVLNLRSPNQVRPMAELLAYGPVRTRLNRTLVERVADFAVALGHTAGSDRAFSANTWTDINAVSLIVQAMPSSQAATTRPVLMSALRRYIVQHTMSARCEDSLRSHRTIRPGDIGRVNAVLCDGAGECSWRVTASDLEPTDRMSGYRIQRFWVSRESSDMHRRLRLLKWTVGAIQPQTGGPVARTDRDTPEWRSDYDALVSNVWGWSGDDEKSPLEFLLQKLILTRSLSELPPDEIRRRRAAADYSRLVLSAADTLTPAQWFLFAKPLIRQALDNSDGYGEVAWVPGYPVLRMYMAISAFRKSRH